MTGTATGRQKERPDSSRDRSSDERLIGRCLKGDQEAWSALIDKYKNLIYSIPIKLGMHQDAGDIFQSVCVDLLSELPRLREHRALPKWLMQTCYHKCLHYQRAADRLVELAPEGTDSNAATSCQQRRRPSRAHAGAARARTNIARRHLRVTRKM